MPLAFCVYRYNILHKIYDSNHSLNASEKSGLKACSSISKERHISVCLSLL